MTALLWFRQDLRIADNPALDFALGVGSIVPVFIVEPDEELAPGARLGAASRWWLHHSLTRLSAALGGLVLRKGLARDIVPELAETFSADTVVWNRCYEPDAIARDKDIKVDLAARGLAVKSFNANLLAEPWDIETGSGGPYKVFSPFWRAVQKRPRATVSNKKPKIVLADQVLESTGLSLKDLDLVPTSPNWAKGWDRHWQPGERGAQKRLLAFVENGLRGYGALRDRPDQDNISRLSPHLHFGEISPRQIWHHIDHVCADQPGLKQDGQKFLSELAWREFSYHLLFHFPRLPTDNLKPEFDAYPWSTNEAHLKAWQKGETGYPMVDAGMRELWQTGFMHNRVRMLTASFLIKHLRLDWRLGQAWFHDTLVDADVANNSASWQWVAGSGADAAPYFRIFNPILQGEKFDPDGTYVTRWVPELSELDKKYIHQPFAAPDEVLEQAGVQLGKTYPCPIVDHSAARAAALKGYDAVKAAKAKASSS